MEELLDVLTKIELFSGFPAECLRDSVLPHRQIQEYRKGVFPFAPQQQVNRFGVILTGKIHLMHIFSEGNYSLMSDLKPGQILGADLIFTRSRLAPYHAMAAADTRVAYFPAELVTRPGMLPEPWRTELLQRFAAWISTMNMKKEYRLAILSQSGLRERIMTYLTMQAARRQKTEFTISYSREELAAFLCVNRSALSHELSRMQIEGLITFRKNYFCLHYLSPAENGQILPF